MREDKHVASTNVCKVVFKQGVKLELNLSKNRGTHFWHKIFQSGKNTRYLGVARWNFNKSQYTVLNQAGTPVSPGNTQNIYSIL